jgi:hypothetical protein
MWSLGWYPYNDPVSRAQERTERMYEREDEALRERIAAERFDEHEWSESQPSGSPHTKRKDEETNDSERN